MKRFIPAAIGMILLLFLASCTTPEPEPPPHEWTIEALGETIVAAGTFWEDWWSMRGAFAPEHLANENLPEHLQHMYTRLLPSSGFESLDDIRDYLLQHYTEHWVNVELSGVYPPFVEFDDVLFMQGVRAGFSRSDWETATHTLVAQDGGHAVVETMVMHGAWHRYPYDDVGAVQVQYTFVFIDGRIRHVERPFS